MLKFGIIGLNEGNGHPYSFSAIFNGFEENLLEKCPYSIIPKYLTQWHKNKITIKDACISHIWTQDVKLSESVAQMTRVPNVANSPTEMIKDIDAVILARDDVENHWEMAKPFLEKGMPIYIDKLLAPNLLELNKFLKATGPDYPIMAGSSSRYTPEIEKAKAKLKNLNALKTIHGVSCCSWLRYASHLLDGICYLIGTEVDTVQNLGCNADSLVNIHFKNGVNVLLQVIVDLALPIQFICYFDKTESHYIVPFTDDTFHSYFMGFYNMLAEFTKMVKTGKQSLKLKEITEIAKIIIAADISSNENNRLVHLSELDTEI